MFCISLYRAEDLPRKEVQTMISEALENLWISDSFSLLIEMLFSRNDNVRSVRLFHMASGYRMEIVTYIVIGKKIESNLIVKEGLDKETAISQLKQILSDN